MSSSDAGPTRDQRQPPVRATKPGVRDVPGCIKYVLLLFLLILLAAEGYAGEFRQFPGLDWPIWLVLLIKIILIIGLLILIWVQRQLNCEITSPTGCAQEDIDPVSGNPRITVTGTASGTVFGHYTLALQGHPECAVTYPAGGGSAPVTKGLLGWIDTSPVSPGNYTVVLEVFPSGAGSSRTCTSNISILRAPVWIDKVGLIKTFDIGAYPGGESDERLRIIEAGGMGTPETAIGGAVSIEGGAYLEGCGKRMFEYSLEFQAAPYGAAPHTPPEMDAPGGWSNIVTLPYGDVPQHPYTWSCGFLIGIPNFITNGILTRSWQIGNCTAPPHPLYYTDSGTRWNTSPLNGRYTVRVRERHKPLGAPGPIEELYDAATVWVDNRTIVAKIRNLMIHGGASLDVCGELTLSQFVPTGQADIIGHAWDPLIVDPPAAPANLEPNENFAAYSVQFKKDGGPWIPILMSVPTPVPNVRQVVEPPPLNTDVLATWDIIIALDAGPLPGGPPPDPGEKLYRGQRCAYIIYLGVSDKTHVSDDGGHSTDDVFPFCIVNDLPNNAPFPWHP